MAAVWAVCTKPQLDRKKNEGRSEKSGRPFCFWSAGSHARSRVKGERQNRTIHKRRVAGKAPRAVGARGIDRFPALPGWAKLCRSYGAEEHLRRGHGRYVLVAYARRRPRRIMRDAQTARYGRDVLKASGPKTRATLNGRALREIGAPFLFLGTMQRAVHGASQRRRAEPDNSQTKSRGKGASSGRCLGRRRVPSPSGLG